ncbi:UNVERIFIED_CONTAM: Copia protein [Sesamum latifolium]|uniref:Copia protein n=1 Tax=Sesamum latifolium TaxID=2727402 RepID=A0AAW2X748_9LAMI
MAKEDAFLVKTLKVVYVLSTPIPEYNVESAKALWDALEAKYTAEDASGKKFLDDDVAWWIDSGATTHACKDRGWFKVFQPVDDGLILHMGNESSAPIVGVGSVVLKFTLEKQLTYQMCCMFLDFSVGIIHETTAPYTPQQNGVSERKNRVLKEMVNSMLSYSGLSDGFWGEAMLTACYLLNRVPNKRNKDDPKIFDEAMKSQDVAFWKEAINDEMDSIMGNNTWVLADLPPGCKPLGCKWIFKKKMKVDGTIEKFKIRLVIQGFRQRPGIDYFDTYAHVARISTIRLLIALASIHNLVIHQMDVKTAFLNGDLDEEVLHEGYGEADVILGIRIIRENKGISISQSHYIEKVLKKFNCFDCTPVSTPMDPSVKLMPNTGKVVFQLEYSKKIILLLVVGYSYLGRCYLLASKKQTCITNSTMESEFVALAAAGKEAEWLRNLIHEIPLWPKPISPISIHCDSAATLAKAYSQMYNGKSRHLGVRHSMIRELIMNGVISVEFVRSQHNLADHLTKGLARDLVHKSVIGMGLKSI